MDEGTGRAPLQDGALEAALTAHFGFAGFREGQREVIGSVLSGRPTVAVMPTGAGKSLCYQLPAVLLPGVALVVSPLIALMKDQVDALVARGIPATFINSSLSEGERLDRAVGMQSGAYRLVYVAPERFRSARFLEVLARTPLSLFAVDEAHCISQWGHDFRPDYARLGEVRSRLRPPRTVALTATATPAVQKDIARALRLAEPNIFVRGFDRPNLFLEVAKVSSEEDKGACLQQVVSTPGSGIVYVATRKRAEKVTESLRESGKAALCYHAGLSDLERVKVQDAFMSERESLLVATNAFGMGVDKPDVRYVVHADAPRSLDAYYQEAGRAGRDGAPAHALLLFNPGDLVMQERMISDAHPEAPLVRDLWNLLRKQRVVEGSVSKLAGTVGARRSQVFATLRLLERAGHVERGHADAPGKLSLVKKPGQITLSTRAGMQRAVLEAARALTGGEPFEVTLEQVATRAGLAEPSVRRAVQALAEAGVVSYRAPVAGRAIRVLEPDLPPEALRVNMEFVRWRERRERALLDQVAQYAWSRGCRRKFLLGYFGEKAPFRCPGCDRCVGGKVKSPGEEKRRRRRTPAKRPQKGVDTRAATLSLWQQGLRVEQIARVRELSADTVRGHLADLIEQGEAINALAVVAHERAELIEEILEERPPSLVAVKRALPPDFGFGEIRVVMAARRRRGTVGQPARFG